VLSLRPMNRGALRFPVAILAALALVAIAGSAAAQDAAPAPSDDAPAALGWPETQDVPASAPRPRAPEKQAEDAEAPSSAPLPPPPDARALRRERKELRRTLVDRDRRNEIFGIAGLGTPEGFVGLELVRRVGPLLELALGGGSGFGGLQWAAMPRIRVGEQVNAFTLGLGVSGGQHAAFPSFGDESSPTTPAPTEYILWANLEAGWEHIAYGGFALRVFGGLTHGWPAHGERPLHGDLLTFPYGGVGLGAAF